MAGVKVCCKVLPSWCRLTSGSNRSLRSLGRAKARPLTKRYKPLGSFNGEPRKPKSVAYQIHG